MSKVVGKTHGFAFIDLINKKHNGNIAPALTTFTYPSQYKNIYHKKYGRSFKKIAKNTKHKKKSFQIIVSDNKTRFRTRFNPPIQMDKDRKYEIALVNLETCYSFPNIDVSSNMFIYSSDNGTKKWEKGVTTM